MSFLFRWIMNGLLFNILFVGITSAKPPSTAPAKTETYVRVSDEKMMRITTHTDGSVDTTYFPVEKKTTETETATPPKPKFEAKSTTVVPKSPTTPSRPSDTARLFGSSSASSRSFDAVEDAEPSFEDREILREIGTTMALISATHQQAPPLFSIVNKRGEFSEYITALRNSNEMIRLTGALALVESGTESVPYLLNLITTSSDQTDRVWACACLGVIGTAASSEVMNHLRYSSRPSTEKWLKYAYAATRVQE